MKMSNRRKRLDVRIKKFEDTHPKDIKTEIHKPGSFNK